MPFDPTRHHRRSIRLAEYDYTQAGAYFITIIIQDRQRILANIDASGHKLTLIGQAVARCWLALPRHFPNIALDAWVLMPDHMHGILMLYNDESRPAASGAASYSNGTRPGSLNAVVQNFKSISTRKANQLRRAPGAPLWQRDYYEHIVRDHADIERIRRYITANPTR